MSRLEKQIKLRMEEEFLAFCERIGLNQKGAVGLYNKCGFRSAARAAMDSRDPDPSDLVMVDVSRLGHLLTYALQGMSFHFYI